MSAQPLITVAVPSFNQAKFLAQSLSSICDQGVPLEIFVADGGSTDGSVDILKTWSPRLDGWRSRPDKGQAAAINECIARGSAPYVCWLNSDDTYLSGGLQTLLVAMQGFAKNAGADNAIPPAAYGRAWDIDASGHRRSEVWVRPFSARLLAVRCMISQPATLIRRDAWEAVGGVDESLHMAMDYDLWWRLYKKFGPLQMVDQLVANNREHADTKTSTRRRAHYREAMQVVKRHYGRVPLKWWIAQPYAVWYRTLYGTLRSWRAP